MELLSKKNNLQTDQLKIDESIFSTANGYLGVRGTFCEGYGTNELLSGTFINGVYEQYKYSYEENLPGFPEDGQAIIDLVDGQSIEFIIGGEYINIKTSKVIDLNRFYDLEKGYTSREIHYLTTSGKEFILTEKRLVSFNIKELFVINISIKSLNLNDKITIISKMNLPKVKKIENIDPRKSHANSDNLDINDIGIKNNIGFIVSKTKKTNILMMTSMSHSYEGFKCKYNYNESNIEAKTDISLKPGEQFSFTKYLIYTTSNHHDNFTLDNNLITSNSIEIPFEKHLSNQTKYLEKFWKKSLIKIYGNSELETTINYNLYQLNSSGPMDKRFSIAAKGLSGTGYEGHYFWDTEIYMLPFFTLTHKEKAKNLLMYRYMNLEKARKEAQALGHTKGVKIPWRTIDGSEVSPYYPAGTAQYHINSDIAYAFIKYYEVTKDIDFMVDYGFKVVYETALGLYEIGNYANNKFHLNNVTGPDEYTTCVDDNYYTNSMAQYHFRFINEFYSEFEEKLQNKNILVKDINNFARAALKMNLIFSKELNIFAQDKTFLDKKKWDFENTPKSNYPLLLNYHPLMIYRHQVLKQADVLLSMFLLDYKNTEVLNDTFNYYNKITTHDSSLSKCVHCIIAAKLGNTDLAYKYLKDISMIDIHNTHNNTADGLHVANMGGSYLAMIYGFGGIRIYSNHLVINPVVPVDLKGYKFNINYQGSEIKVKVTDKVTITSSKKVNIKVYDKQIQLLGTYETNLK